MIASGKRIAEKQISFSFFIPESSAKYFITILHHHLKPFRHIRELILRHRPRPFCIRHIHLQMRFMPLHQHIPGLRDIPRVCQTQNDQQHSRRGQYISHPGPDPVLPPLPVDQLLHSPLKALRKYHRFLPIFPAFHAIEFRLKHHSDKPLRLLLFLYLRYTISPLHQMPPSISPLPCEV